MVLQSRWENGCRSQNGRRDLTAKYSRVSNHSTIGWVHHCLQVQPGGGMNGIAVHQGISLISRGGEGGTCSGPTDIGGEASVQPDSGVGKLRAWW